MTFSPDSLAPDMTYLTELSDGDTEFECEMIQTYLDEVPEHRERIIQCADQREWGTLREELHGLKSKLSIMGFISLYEQVDALEALCKTGKDIDKISTEIIPVHKYLKLSIELAKQELKKRQ